MEKRGRFKSIAVLVVISLIITLAVAYYNRTISPLVIDLAESEIKKITVNAIADGTIKLKAYEAFYNEFYTYERNADGDIILVKANTSNINLVSVYAQKELQKSLNRLENKKISIPAGAFTGSSWLADKGKGIAINVMPIGAVETKINSYFFNEGINQTLHRLVLRVTSTVRVVVPVKAEDVTVTTDILLAEDVIAGRVPESYVTGISDDNIYDLLP